MQIKKFRVQRKQTKKASKTGENIRFLRDSAERNEVFINFLTMINKENSIFSLKNLRYLKANKADKKESVAINNLKKVDFFNKSINFLIIE